MTLDDLQTYLGDANVRAFLRVIRAGESNQNDDAYSLLNGGGHFTDLSKHPWDGIPTTQGAKACGAYQFLGTTWKAIREQYGIPDFSPVSQDCGAVGDIINHHALADIMAGKLASAIAGLEREWVSLPGLLADGRAHKVFTEYGGGPTEPQAAQPAPTPEPATTAPETAPKAPMPFLALIPLIAQLIPALRGIPALAPILGAPTGQPATAPPVFTPPATGSMHGGDYIALAQTILDTFLKAVPGAANPTVAVGMAQADPAVAKAASDAVMSHPDVVAALNAQIPVFDAIAKYDAATNAAQIAGANAAAARATGDKWDMTPTIVTFAGATATLISLALLGAIIYQALSADRKIDTALVGLAGPLLAISMNLWREVFSYRFDGTPAANATAAVNQQIAAMNATKQ